VLEGHVIFGLETNTGTEDVSQSRTLLSQRIDDRSSSGSERSLKHVAQDAQHRVEATEISSIGTMALPLDTRHHLSYKHKIDDQRGRKKRVLAHIEDADRLVAAQEDLCVVLIQSALVIANGGHVLNDDGVVGVLALLVQNGIGSDHVVNDVRLADFFGAELAMRRQVHAVVVAEVVVRCNRGQFDTGADQEVDEGGLHFGLSRLEVVTADEGVVALGELDSTRNEGILG
jgi:hypothetical protein